MTTAPPGAPIRPATVKAVAAALAALTFALHAPLLPFGFYADDYGQMREIHADLEAGRAPFLASARATVDETGRLGIAIFRPALEAMNAGLILLGGRDAEGRLAPPSAARERVLSLCWRALLPPLLFLLLLRLGFAPAAAAAGALFSAIHPAPYNATAWIAARGDLVWPPCVVGAFLFAAPRAGAAPAPRAGRPVAAVALFVLALAAKETALLLTPVWWFALAWGARRGAFTPRAAGVAAASVAALGLGYLALRRALFADAGAAYPGLDPDDLLGSATRLVARSLAASWPRFLGGRGFDPDEPAWSRAATIVAAAAGATTTLVGAFRAAATRGRRGPVVVAFLCGALSAAPALIQNGLDLMTSRLLPGWTAALGVAAAAAAESRLGVRVVLGALVALAASFAAETASSLDLCRRFDDRRAEVVRAAAAAGPDANVLVFTPRRTLFPETKVPDWATNASLRRAFLGLRREVYHAPDEGSVRRVRDALRPDRLRVADAAPLVLARGDFLPSDRTLRHRCVVLPAFSESAPATASLATEGADVARGALPAGAPPRAYPTWRITLEAAPGAAPEAGEVVVDLAFTAGDETVRRTLEAPRPMDGARTFEFGPEFPPDFAASASTTVRAEVRIRAAGVRLVAAALLRAAPSLVAEAPRAGTRATPAAPPLFAVRNGAGLPFAALVIEARLGNDVVVREFVRETPTGTADGAGARVVFDGADGPAALLALAAPALADGPLALRARYEARARVDGPAGATTETIVFPFAPR